MFLNSLLAKAKWYPILFDSPANIVRSTAFWLTVALAAAFVVWFALAKNKARVLKVGLIGGVGYSCALVGLLSAFTFKEDGIQPMLFYPLAAVGAVVLISAAAVGAISKKRPEKKKLAEIVAVLIVAVALIAALAVISVYYGKNFENDGYYNSDAAHVDQAVLYLGAIGLIALIAALAFFGDGTAKQGFNTKSLAYAGVCVAMSFALSYLRIVKLPQGGSVTIASLLPLLIYSYLFGAKKGVITGFIYGLLQAVQDPWIIHPAQFLLDYPVAFASIGLTGIFGSSKTLDKRPRLQFALGAIFGGAMRFICHVLSGVFAFAAYANGQNPLVYSLAYNSFVFADIALAIAAGVLVFSSKSFLKVTRSVKTAEQNGGGATNET